MNILYLLTIEERKNSEILKQRINLLQVGDIISCIIRKFLHTTPEKIIAIGDDYIVIEGIELRYYTVIYKNNLVLLDGIVGYCFSSYDINFTDKKIYEEWLNLK